MYLGLALLFCFFFINSGKSEEEQIMNKPTGVRLFFGTFVTKYDYSSCEHVRQTMESFTPAVPYW